MLDVIILIMMGLFIIHYEVLFWTVFLALSWTNSLFIPSVMLDIIIPIM